MKTLDQFLKVRSQLLPIITELNSLGIKLNPNPRALHTITLNWKDGESYINKAVNELDFFDQLTFEEEIALALAVTQEEINDYLPEKYIKLVNDFFDLKISNDLINKIGNRFI